MTAATWLIFNWITYKSRRALSGRGRNIIQRLAVLITDQWLLFVMSRGSSPDGASQLFPSTEAVKALNSLESLLNSKHYQELRSSVEHAIKLVTDPSNSLHNASYILGVLATDLFQHKYLLVLKVSVMICDASCCLLTKCEWQSPYNPLFTVSLVYRILNDVCSGVSNWVCIQFHICKISSVSSVITTYQMISLFCS